MRRLAATFTLASLLAAAAGAGEGPEGWFADAVRLAGEDDLDGAIASVEKVLAVEPRNPDALWNLGLWSAEAGRNERALEIWTRYREAQPGDWRGLAKLVQTHQALGDLEARDRERDALLERYARATEIEKASMDLFCREQLRAGDQRVMAFESFTPGGERPVHYRFSVLSPDGKEERWFLLRGSELAPDEARYRLERHDADGVAIVNGWPSLPSYDDVRERVLADLARGLAP